MAVLEHILAPFASEWLSAFMDPRKRVFWGYLLSAFVVAVAWLMLANCKSLRASLRIIFDRATWCSPSARADYVLMAANNALMLLLSPQLLAKATVAYLVFEGLHGLFEGRPLVWARAADWHIALLFTTFLFLLDDFARYWVHRWLHTAPVLWSFHRVHHSATVLNPITVFRTHPIEAVLFSIRGAVVQGVCIALFFFLFGDKVTLVAVLGASVFTFLFNALGSNLRHSPVALPFWRPVERVLMSPAQHQIHHSAAPQHHNRNYGVALSLWDWLFGTLCYSEKHQQLVYGLAGKADHATEHRLSHLYFEPFKHAAKHLPFRRRTAYMAMSPRRPMTLTGALLTATLLLISFPAPADDATVNIYSARKEALILPLLERFKAETGIGFRLVTGKADGLLKRLEIEGELSPADLFITVDAGRLQRAKKSGVLQPVRSRVLETAIPPSLRDKDHYWFGVSLRARTIIYARDRVDPTRLSTYEALADTQWKRKLCIRSSGNIYNQSLVASMIVASGVERAESWARKLMGNLARPPAGGDTDQLKAVAAGQCDLTLVNTYYLGRLINSENAEEREIGAKLAVFWPNQGPNDRGAHVNVSGVGITKHAKNRLAAITLMEYLATESSQAWYAEVNNEYPVVPGAPISDTLTAFGPFKADALNLTKLGENNAAAVKLMDRAGWR